MPVYRIVMRIVAADLKEVDQAAELMMQKGLDNEYDILDAIYEEEGKGE